jgi:periplasmic protein TonB
MNRLTLRPLMPATASLLIHLGLGGLVGIALDQAPVRMPVLMAELVEAEAPPAAEPPPQPMVRKRPVAPPKPRATPLPAEPSPPPEPEPPSATVPVRPRPTTPEPPRPAAPEPPKATAPPPPAAAAPEPTPPTHTALEQPPTETAPPRDASTPPVSAPPDARPGALATATPTELGPPGGSASSSAREPTVAALPSDGVTQRAIPRGGYQYRPTYPARARRLGIQGTTLLHVLVADTGRVVEVIVKQSAGHPDLDQAAADAVRRWRFEPARSGREPVEMWVQLPFEFRLR